MQHMALWRYNITLAMNSKNAEKAHEFMNSSTDLPAGYACTVN